jgi:protein-tyrosine phosphatase
VVNHQARQFSKQDFSDFDYIIAMDRSNKRNIESLLRKQEQNRQQVFLMRDFEDDPDEPDVPDPYWSGKEGFIHVHRILFKSCKNLLNRIIEEHQLK